MSILNCHRHRHLRITKRLRRDAVGSCRSLITLLCNVLYRVFSSYSFRLTSFAIPRCRAVIDHCIYHCLQIAGFYSKSYSKNKAKNRCLLSCLCQSSQCHPARMILEQRVSVTVITTLSGRGTVTDQPDDVFAAIFRSKSSDRLQYSALCGRADVGPARYRGSLLQLCLTSTADVDALQFKEKLIK